jgi:hypothetical protein
MPTQSAGVSRLANTLRRPATARDTSSRLRTLKGFSLLPKTCLAAGILTRRAAREPYSLVLEAGERSNEPKFNILGPMFRFCFRLSPRTLFPTLRSFESCSCPISLTLPQLLRQNARKCPAPNRLRCSLASETRCLQSESVAVASGNWELFISFVSSASSADRSWASMPGPSSSAAFPCAGLPAGNSFTRGVTARSLSKSWLIPGSVYAAPLHRV